MNRQRNVSGFSNAYVMRMPSVVLLDLAGIASLPVRGALEDAGLRVLPRRSFADLERTLPYESHSLVIVAVDEIEPAHLEEIAVIRANTDVPIIVVSDTEDLGQRIAAFDAGADEHIAPSARRSEVSARIRARLRRSAPIAATVPYLRLIEPK